MNVASVTAARLVQSFGDRRAQIEAALALGASPRQCTASVMRRPVRLAKVPLVDSTKTMPIVLLPGATTGMILAGADPHAGGRRVHAAGGGLAGPLSSSRDRPRAPVYGADAVAAAERRPRPAVALPRTQKGREALRPPAPLPCFGQSPTYQITSDGSRAKCPEQASQQA